MVKATIDTAHYACSLSNGTHVVTADEPLELGGTNKGFAPTGLLMAALASCVAITLRMYIDKKGWLIDHIEVDVNMEVENGETVFIEEIICTGHLDEVQKSRLEQIASRCPVSKILTEGHEVRSKIL